jgi:hypothetical protein
MNRPTPKQTVGWLHRLADSVEKGKFIPERVEITGKTEELEAGPDSEWSAGERVIERTFSFTFCYPEMGE